MCCLKETKSSPRVSIESNPLGAYPWIESGVKSEWYRTGKEDGSTSPTPEIPNSIASLIPRAPVSEDKGDLRSMWVHAHKTLTGELEKRQSQVLDVLLE